MIAYKFLRRDGTGVFTRFDWPLPAGGEPARIAEERDGPEAYHVERARQVAWLAERLRL